MTETSAKPRALFAATIEPEAVEHGTTSKGVDYVTLRDAQVVTEFETIERTVMAFGRAATTLRGLIDAKAPLQLTLYQSGGILKVDGEDARIAA